MDEVKTFEGFRTGKIEIFEILKEKSAIPFQEITEKELLLLKMGNEVAAFRFPQTTRSFFVIPDLFRSGGIIITRINTENNTSYLAVDSTKIDIIKNGRDFDELNDVEKESQKRKILQYLWISNKMALSAIYICEAEKEMFLELIYKNDETVIKYLQRLALFLISKLREKRFQVAEDELEEIIGILINDNIQKFDVTTGYSLRAFFSPKFYYSFINKATSLSKKVAISLNTPLSNDDSAQTLGDIIEDQKHFPNEIEKKDLKEKVRKIIAQKLPARLQTIYKLKYEEERTDEEISKIMNAPIGTVKSWYSRDLKKEVKKILKSR